MKKKILFIVLSSLFIFTATGCKRHIKLKYEEPTIEDVNKIGKYIKNADLSFNDVTFRNMMDEALSDIKGATSYDDIYANTLKVFNMTKELIRKYYIADALYNSDPNNEEYEETRDLLNDVYLDYETFRASFIYELSSNYDILKQFFEGYSDEEIDFEVELSKKKKEAKYKQIKEELDDISGEFDKLNISIYDSTNTNQVAEITYRFINKNKELSEYLGFDTYLYYKDIEYKRIYTDIDVNNFTNYTKQYIIPLMNGDGNTIDISRKASTLSYPEYAFISEFESTSVFDKDYYTLNLANDYARNMGGDYYRTYKDFIDNGHFLFANNDDSLEGAYTNPYLSYFGPNYQDVGTLIHEFGHYYSMNVGYADYKSLDIQEFFSQANEFLFMTYLQNNSYKNVQNVFELQSELMISNACKTMVIGSALREFENKVYTTTLSSPTDIIDIWSDLNENEYNKLLSDYWKIEVRYDMYYLSYSTSITGALSIYNYSQTNYKDAKQKYLSICANINIEDDIEEALKKVKISSPFDEETFKNIKKLVEEKR